MFIIGGAVSSIIFEDISRVWCMVFVEGMLMVWCGVGVLDGVEAEGRAEGAGLRVFW